MVLSRKKPEVIISSVPVNFYWKTKNGGMTLIKDMEKFSQEFWDTLP
mgnify:CR=1 FL=1